MTNQELANEMKREVVHLNLQLKRTHDVEQQQAIKDEIRRLSGEISRLDPPTPPIRPR